MYNWKIATPKDFEEIYSFLCNSSLAQQWGIDGMQRRLFAPLIIGHLVAFYNQVGKLCGFVTLGFLSDEAGKHQATAGIQNNDWRSGNNFWVIDMVSPDGGCPQMLRTLMRSCNQKTARYFRKKYNRIDEVKL